jgi:hypothetical protein
MKPKCAVASDPVVLDMKLNPWYGCPECWKVAGYVQVDAMDLLGPQAGFWASSKQILEPKLPPCSLLPAEVAVPSSRQKQFILQTLDIHQQLNYIKQLDLEEFFHLYSFDLPYPSTNTSPS